MSKLKSSEMNKRLTFYKAKNVSNGAGGYTEDWSKKEGFEEVHKCWGRVITPFKVKSSDFVEAMQEKSVVSHEVRIRYTSKIKTDQYIDYNGKKLKIIDAVNHREENKWLLISCIED